MWNFTADTDDGPGGLKRVYLTIAKKTVGVDTVKQLQATRYERP
jgi:hypothetical protein